MNSLIETISSKFYLTFVYEDRWEFFLDGLIMTIILTLGAFILGTLFGIIMCALKLSKLKWLKKLGNLINSLLIEIPTTVILLIFAYLIFANSSLSSTIIAIIALCMKEGAYMTDIFYTAINNVEKGESEAARSLGLSKTQTFFHITLPQAIKTAMPVYKNQFVTTLQETSVVGYIAIQDLTRASNIVTSRTLDAMFGLIAISIIYLLIGYIATSLLSLFEKEHHLGGGSVNDRD